MDITTYELGDTITDLKCPKCKKKSMRLVGLFGRQEKSHELECLGCFYSEKTNPKNAEFTYVDPEEKKKKKKGKNQDNSEEDFDEEV